MRYFESFIFWHVLYLYLHLYYLGIFKSNWLCLLQINWTCWLSEKIISQPPEQGIPPFLKRRTLTDNIFIDAGWESNPWWPSTWLAWQTRRASLKCSWDKVPAAQGQLAFPERFLFHLYFWPQKYRNTEIETNNLNLKVSYLYLASLRSRSIH